MTFLHISPLALKVLGAYGYPTEGFSSKAWDVFAGPGAPRMDFVITVCDSAAGEACPLWPGQPVTALLAPVSGAHFNPVVTALLAVRRALSFREAASYTAARVLGGLVGTVLAHAMFALPLAQYGAAERSGANLWLAEAVATAGLVLAILVGHRSRPEALPWLVGLYITAAYWFTASTAFANPAVTLARSLTATFAGIRPEDVAGFVAAQILGACLGAALAHGLRPRAA